MQSENGISIYISVDLCNQKTAPLYTYQSTYAIRKRHVIAVLHISKPWKWKKKKIEKGGVGCKKGGDAVVLSTSTCGRDNALGISRNYVKRFEIDGYFYLYQHRLSRCICIFSLENMKNQWFASIALF